MIIGFTGSRGGMTKAQHVCVRRLLVEAFCTVLHHGDCVGADAQVHVMARELGLIAPVRIITHPMVNAGKYAAHCVADMMLQPESAWARNNAIVVASERVIATPSSAEEQVSSGTWMTVRLAERKCTLVLPDGRLIYR